MNELFTQCTLCVVLGLLPLEGRPPAGVGLTPPSSLFGPYAGAGFPVWTWHSLQLLMEGTLHPWPYRIMPEAQGIPPSLWPEPIRGGMTIEQVLE